MQYPTEIKLKLNLKQIGCFSLLLLLFVVLSC